MGTAYDQTRFLLMERWTCVCYTNGWVTRHILINKKSKTTFSFLLLLPAHGELFENNYGECLVILIRAFQINWIKTSWTGGPGPISTWSIKIHFCSDATSSTSEIFCESFLTSTVIIKTKQKHLMTPRLRIIKLKYFIYTNTHSVRV